jgi:pimeloyl-ACP methyl ester carboxylesterase
MRNVDEGTGSRVVMVHGNPTWSRKQRPLILGLRGCCRRIAPDHPGFGLSDEPPDRIHLPQQHAGNLAALLAPLRLNDATCTVDDSGEPIARGMKDIAFRDKEPNRWIATYPDARVVRFPDAGHFLPEERPDELLPEIRTILNDGNLMEER